MKLGKRDWIRRFVSIRYVVVIHGARLRLSPLQGSCLSEWKAEEERKKLFNLPSPLLPLSAVRETFSRLLESLYFHFALPLLLFFMWKYKPWRAMAWRNFTALWSTKRLLFHSLLLAREIYWLSSGFWYEKIYFSVLVLLLAPLFVFVWQRYEGESFFFTRRERRETFFTSAWR